MKSLKVVFLGTPEFAKTSLEAIHQSRHEVVGVVTVADKASGRGQKVNQSPVKIFAVEHNIPVFQPEKLRNPEFLEELRMLNADIFVVVAFRMMPKILFEMPRMGTFNLHASLLPDYRGAAPINYAVINGEEKTGATTFFINEKIDEGNILLQEELDILPDENAGSLHDRLMEMGAGLVVKTLDGLADGSIKEKPQPQVEHPKNAYKIFKEDTRINWAKNSKEVHQFILGMSPYPAAFTTLKIGEEEKGLKIFGGKFEISEHGKPTGSLDISKNEFKIYTGDGIYFPLELQLEGKKRMNIKDFLNGFKSFEHITMA
ncbi:MULTISPECIES: methionyl-tRNA formyltransferase [Chryseobacterium]|uniref:Methionyl-tRNA formyltransferase n=1 Tax=Chryseobacterium camelliae TaxID=1265445 RepID=A0ABU0TMH7_9FLAO|nr:MULTISPECIES: methionyl-tRNA formyltransferase [Chryseobacterium]MDT3408719.1 methionyl-tRNA formyltransferase [Pseudacidovorax intermedius]MDQ1097428.1 methionyl-tRNA formyltransferase [Chryseobacterium camelliae]MDQ1101356.1 methionyl-tRNA formyltransferase [Chryseobacterium sp. SORGH_AS_1048]MDR6084801.1 methionyl-tRNA formyltransferase [Chryseobacterium sp. SORGH_AS_0909]MDR6129148.1 methionyl-tRNA formyltransferase [Chryseobacterium sp. SORGH_AS_1175]